VEIEELSLPGVLLIKLELHTDKRGSFIELLSPAICEAVGVALFPQVNISESSEGVFRGMHLQAEPFGQAKLVQCLSGAVLDFVVDVSPSSKTQGNHLEIELREGTGYAIFIPSRYAHGFLAKQDSTRLLYAVSAPRKPSHEVSIDFSTTSVAKSLYGSDPILSEKDQRAMSLSDYLEGNW